MPKLDISEDQMQFVVNALQKYTDDNRHSWPDHFVAFADGVIAAAKASQE